MRTIPTCPRCGADVQHRVTTDGVPIILDAYRVRGGEWMVRYDLAVTARHRQYEGYRQHRCERGASDELA